MHSRPRLQWPGNSGASIDDRRMRFVPQRNVSPSRTSGLTQPTSEAGSWRARGQPGISPSSRMIIMPKTPPAIIARIGQGRSAPPLTIFLRRRGRRKGTIVPCRRLRGVLSILRKSKSSFMQHVSMKSNSLSSGVTPLADEPFLRDSPRARPFQRHARIRNEADASSPLPSIFAACRDQHMPHCPEKSARDPVSCPHRLSKAGFSADGMHNMIVPSNVHPTLDLTAFGRSCSPTRAH